MTLRAGAENQEVGLSSTAGISHKRKPSNDDPLGSVGMTGTIKRIKIEEGHQDCAICIETKPPQDFPRITTCDHRPEVCRDCLKTNFITRIKDSEDGGWGHCVCPLCNQAISPKRAQRALGPNSEVAEVVKEVECANISSERAVSC